MKWLSEWMTEWVTDWLIDWLSAWLNDWPTTDWLTDWPTDYESPIRVSEKRPNDPSPNAENIIKLIGFCKFQWLPKIKCFVQLKRFPAGNSNFWHKITNFYNFHSPLQKWRFFDKTKTRLISVILDPKLHPRTIPKKQIPGASLVKSWCNRWNTAVRSSRWISPCKFLTAP